MSHSVLASFTTFLEFHGTEVKLCSILDRIGIGIFCFPAASEANHFF